MMKGIMGTISAVQDPEDNRYITVTGSGFEPNLQDAGLVMEGVPKQANLVGFQVDGDGNGSAIMYWAIAPAGMYTLCVYSRFRVSGGGLHYSHPISNEIQVVIT